MFDTFEEEVFRLQTLSQYTVDREQPAYREFLTGLPLPPDGFNEAWLQKIKQRAAGGRSWTNVHVLPSGLTPYLRFLIDWAYAYQHAVGADIRFASDQADALHELPKVCDFWLFDRRHLFWMRYDDEGRFIGSELEEDLHIIGRVAATAAPLRQGSICLRQLLAQRRTGGLV